MNFQKNKMELLKGKFNKLTFKIINGFLTFYIFYMCYQILHLVALPDSVKLFLNSP